jgi:hypothetical protein
VARATITIEWPPIPGAPGYDLFENGRKVASTTKPSARFSVGSGGGVEIRAQLAPVPTPTPPAVTKTFTGPSGANIDAFLDSLKPGDVAGLPAGGTFPFSSYQRKAHGTAAAPIVLTSVDPTRPATIAGRFVTYAGDATTPAGDWWTLRQLGIDGRTSDASSMTIQSRGCRLELCDFSNWNTNIGIIVSSAANGFTVDSCRIHDVGVIVPARDNEEHGIYDEGNGTHVVDCLVYRCAARGIQDRGGHTSLYEQTTISECGEGIIFGDDRGAVSSIARRLILVDQQESGRYLVEEFDPNHEDSGNLVDDFYAFNKQGWPTVQPQMAQVKVTNPHYANPILDGNLMPTLAAAQGYGCRVQPPKILANA